MSEVYVYINDKYDGKAKKAIVENNTLKIEDYVPHYRVKDVLKFNNNQHFVLNELRKYLAQATEFNKFQVVYWLLTTIIQYPNSLLAEAYRSLNEEELEAVFQEFGQWLRK